MACTVCVQVRGLCWLPADAPLACDTRWCVSLWLACFACTLVCQAMACTVCVQVRGLCWLPADAHLPVIHAGVSVYGSGSLLARRCVRSWLAQSACRSEGSAGCQLTRTCLQHTEVSQAGVSHHGLRDLRAGPRALLAASSLALACSAR